MRLLNNIHVAELKYLDSSGCKAIIPKANREDSKSAGNLENTVIIRHRLGPVLYSLASQCVVHRTSASASNASLIEQQHLRDHFSPSELEPEL